jgi:hypothetical protein
MEESVYSPTDNIWMFLGHRANLPEIKTMLTGFNVYLHERGQLWPREGMELIGQTEVTLIRQGREVHGSFQVSQLQIVFSNRKIVF